MKSCSKECIINKKCCNKSECRHHINYKEDLNCCLIAIAKRGNMTLSEVGERLGISYVRVKQIETVALNKLQKKRLLSET